MSNYFIKQKLDITLINKLSQNPKLFEKGTALFGDDPHISKHMLQAHLNAKWDAASRRDTIICNTVNWISENFIEKKSDILDLGCGPGLYAKKIASLGHHILGIDYSKRSIEYAKTDAKKNRLKIDYLYKDYLTIDYDGVFDVILLIYCDFGVLNDEERATLFKKVHKALRPNGIFIFDIFNEKYSKSKNIGRNWLIEDNGFWAEEEYINMSETFHYPASNKINVYRTWNRYYSANEMGTLLNTFHFSNHQYYENIIKESNFLSSDVTFIVTKKI